jgi:hypothetical protein
LGVPAGAIRPNQPEFSKPGKPLSATVGTSGSILDRSALVTASARSLPPVTSGVAAPMLPTTTCTWPAIRSVSAADSPLYGMCVRSMPAV